MIAEAWQRKKKKKIMSETFGTKLFLIKLLFIDTLEFY